MMVNRTCTSKVVELLKLEAGAIYRPPKGFSPKK